MTEEQASLVIRTLNWLAWIALVLGVLRADRPVTRTSRQTISLVLVFGMTVFEIGGWVPFGFPLQTSRQIATIFCGFALTGVVLIAVTNWRTTRSRRRG